MKTQTTLSGVYSVQPGYASKRTAVEAMLQFGGITDRAPLWFVVALPIGLTIVTVAWFPIGAGLSLLALLTSPFIIGWWHERRVCRAAVRICSRRLCLGCSYPLFDVLTSQHGNGLCPECGRHFNVVAYASDHAAVPCAECGYDLRALPGATLACPECGASIHRVRAESPLG